MYQVAVLMPWETLDLNALTMNLLSCFFNLLFAKPYGVSIDSYEKSCIKKEMVKQTIDLDIWLYFPSLLKIKFSW